MLFDISQSPETAFAAPVTDVTLMTLKKGQAVDPQVNVANFVALPTGAQGVCIGVNLKNFRKFYKGRIVSFFSLLVQIIPISDASFLQEHYDALNIPVVKELNESAFAAMLGVTFELKHDSFEKIL